MNTFEQEIGEVIGVMRDAAMLDLVAIASFFPFALPFFLFPPPRAPWPCEKPS